MPLGLKDPCCSYCVPAPGSYGWVAQGCSCLSFRAGSHRAAPAVSWHTAGGHRASPIAPDVAKTTGERHHSDSHSELAPGTLGSLGHSQLCCCIETQMNLYTISLWGRVCASRLLLFCFLNVTGASCRYSFWKMFSFINNQSWKCRQRKVFKVKIRIRTLKVFLYYYFGLLQSQLTIHI